VEAHETTKNRCANQETQVGMPRPYTAETDRRHNRTSPRVEPPNKRRIHGEEWCFKRQKEWKRPGQKSSATPRIEFGGGFLWMPNVPQRNYGTIY